MTSLITALHGILQADAKSLGYTFAIAWVGTIAVTHVALLDKEFGIAHSSCSVYKE